jgi:hypothetical protein
MRRMPMSPPRDLGRFVADVSFERFPAKAVDVARGRVIDCIARVIEGPGDPGRQLRKALNPTGGEVSLYFNRLKDLEGLSARELTKVG